jgi:hypothetical protein
VVAGRQPADGAVDLHISVLKHVDDEPLKLVLSVPLEIDCRLLGLVLLPGAPVHALGA